MCAQCGNPHVSDTFELCLACSIELRREFYRGLGQLTEYLTSWAAFADWEAGHAVEAR